MPFTGIHTTHLVSTVSIHHCRLPLLNELHLCCLFCVTFCFLASIICWAADCRIFFALFSSCSARLAARAAAFSFSCSLLSFTVSVSLRTRFLFKSAGGDGGGVSDTDSMSDCLDLCSFEATFWKVSRPPAA